MVSKYCCCCDLSYGLVIHGVIMLILIVVGAILMVLFYFPTLKPDYYYQRHDLIKAAITLTVYTCYTILCNVLLIVGVTMDSSAVLNVCLILECVGIVAWMVLVVLMAIVVHPFIAIALVMIIYLWYYWACLLSYYRELYDMDL